MSDNTPGLQPQKTNAFAVTSMILGIIGLILGWTVFFFFASILAVVFGHISLSQLNRSQENGRGMAIAGLVTGYISVAFWGIILLFAGFLAALTSSI